MRPPFNMEWVFVPPPRALKKRGAAGGLRQTLDIFLRRWYNMEKDFGGKSC